MDDEGDGPLLVTLSALEHWSYCPRQCGLIHLEQTFDENYYTVRGQLAHARADSGVASTEHGMRITRDVPVWSDRLHLIGKLDVLELHGDVPYPVELKSGQKRDWVHEAVQLCGQALCLEEMLGCAVPAGAIAYLGSHRRREVVFTETLRERTEAVAHAVRSMLEEENLPRPVNDRRCRECSLLESCLPSVLVQPARIHRLYRDLFRVDEQSREPG